jgi:hypothetical protein
LKLHIFFKKLDGTTYESIFLKSQGGISLPDVSANFFAAGVDSLRAIQMRRILKGNLDLGNRMLPTNIVYDAGNTAMLARILHTMQTEAPSPNGFSGLTKGDELDVMKRLVQEYSSFEGRRIGIKPDQQEDVVVSVLLVHVANTAEVGD